MAGNGRKWQEVAGSVHPFHRIRQQFSFTLVLLFLYSCFTLLWYFQIKGYERDIKKITQGHLKCEDSAGCLRGRRGRSLLPIFSRSYFSCMVCPSFILWNCSNRAYRSISSVNIGIRHTLRAALLTGRPLASVTTFIVEGNLQVLTDAASTGRKPRFWFLIIFRP